MEESYFTWDENNKKLILVGYQQIKEVPSIGQENDSRKADSQKLYCPHANLFLEFRESLTPIEKIKFRKRYQRKSSTKETDIVYLKDIKDLVLYLLLSPVNNQFKAFFQVPLVDRFLRACIIYIQAYTDIWEKMQQEYAATLKQLPNPLTGGKRGQYARQLQIIRHVLGAVYAELLLAFQHGNLYHHMISGNKEILSNSRPSNEKDLRTFEILFGLTHRIVWVALQRKYFNLIELELHRIFRTDIYNIAARNLLSNSKLKNMLESDMNVLQGSYMFSKHKLLRNTPLLHDLLHLSTDKEDTSNNSPEAQILYWKNALIVKEKELSQLQIKIGILGEDRSNFDLMLIRLERDKI
ncbi:protein phosphatase 1 regulatory subunit 36-like [Prorops nasuta]|uniref:protein phosphatase 1 regulatory subunit 36-like n=1 Tax=Prorops nasuta TaxID=863751 RepID=UPI0034CD3C9D